MSISPRRKRTIAVPKPRRSRIVLSSAGSVWTSLKGLSARFMRITHLGRCLKADMKRLSGSIPRSRVSLTKRLRVSRLFCQRSRKIARAERGLLILWQGTMILTKSRLLWSVSSLIISKCMRGTGRGPCRPRRRLISTSISSAITVCRRRSLPRWKRLRSSA